MRRARSILQEHGYIIALICALAVAIPGFLRVEDAINRIEDVSDRQATQTRCIREWGDTTSARAERLTKINQELSESRNIVFNEMELFLTMVEQRDSEADIGPLLESLHAQRAVWERQQEEVEENPVPGPPGEVCPTLPEE